MKLNWKGIRYGGRWVPLLLCFVLALGVLVPFGGQRASAAIDFEWVDGGGTGQIANLMIAQPIITEYNGELYLTMMYQDANIQTVRVFKYTAPTWTVISGSGLQMTSLGETITTHPRLVAHGNALYAYWSEGIGSTSKLRVKKYENGSWTVADDGAGLNIDTNSNVLGAYMISHGGALYAFWGESPQGINNLQIRAKKLVNGSWESAESGAPLGNLTIAIPFASSIVAEVYNNALYVAWGEGANLRVKRLDSNGWQLVDGGVLSGTILYPSLRVLNNELFAMWVDGAQLKAQKYNGSNWVAVENGLGNGIFPVMTAANGTLYAAYYQTAPTPCIVLKRYDGSAWVTESESLQSFAFPFDMLVHNNELYIAYVNMSIPMQVRIVKAPNTRTISPTTAEFDKKLPANVPLTMSAYGYGLTSITDGANSLVLGTDYTVIGTAVTINSSYLSLLPLGPKTLTLNFGVGTPQTLTITITDSTDPQITPTIGTFDKKVSQQSPLNVTMATYGKTLSNIADGSTTLVQGTHYSVNGNTVTLNSSYLASLSVGTKALTFTFSAGAPQTYTINVIDTTQNSIITPTTGTFDKNVAQQSPLSVTMATYGNTLSNIAYGSTPLVQGTHYNVDGNSVTLNNSYLASLEVGTKALTFNFSAGEPQTYTITVIDTTTGPKNSIITPTTGTFDKNVAQQSPLNVTVATYGNTLSNIADGSTPLVQGTHYSVNGNTITLNASYLASLPVGTKELTFNFSAGAPQTYTITVIDTTINPVPNAPVLVSAVAANRQVTLSWTPVNGATSYKVYQTVTSGTYGSSTPITVGGSVYGFTSTEVSNGTTYYYVVKATNSSGDSEASNELSARPFGSDASPSDRGTPNTGVNVLVNGKAEQTGTATTTMVNGQSVTTVVIDPAKLQERLDAAGPNAVITIPIITTSDVAVGELNGQMVSNMEKKQAVIEIKTDSATYTIAAKQIDIHAISAQLGQNVTLSDIKIQIEIAKPTAEKTAIVQNAAKAGEFSLVLPPLEFTVRGVYNGKSFEINKFDTYVERTIAIPDDVDASKITTAIVVDPDGTVRHVPTQIVKIDGKYYAKVSSLTNSLYSLVWHPITFKDAETHWAKDTINNMGSRMIVNGVSNGMFNPDQNMTRAEFAAVIVRGLGLKAESAAASPFKDVKSSDWFSGVVQTAYANGLISGFEDGTFRAQESITREQAMVIIAKAMKITQLQSMQAKAPQAWTPSISDFTDRAAIADWSTASIEDVLKAGLVTGRNGSKLAPKDTVTRAEITVLVERLLQKSQLIN